MLATQDEHEVAPLTLDAHVASELGELEPMLSPYAQRWDPREDFRPDDATDLGWIGEDEKGVWICRHPQAALLEEPDLWPEYMRWSAGVQELSADDYERLSAFDYEVRLTLVSAANRKQRRAMDPEGRDDDPGSG